jgi:hypothetical protein
MTIHEYIAGIEKVSGHPVGPEGSPHWLRMAERYAETLRAIQDRTPALLEQGIQYPDNRVSRALFTAETGIVLPKTQRGSLAVLIEYVGADRVAEVEQAKHDRENAERAERERVRLADIITRFAAGQDVSGSDLLDAAKSLGMDVHPRTAGTFNKLRTVNANGNYRPYPKFCTVKPNPDTFWPVVKLVAAGTDEPATEDDTAGMSAGELAAAESLFRPGGTLAVA